jgi:hypothetical protein
MFKQEVQDGHILVSPASPENAINVCLFNCLVLSSEALRIVAPLIAALEVAMRVKSLPVMPSSTSLWLKRKYQYICNSNRRVDRILHVKVGGE